MATKKTVENEINNNAKVIQHPNQKKETEKTTDEKKAPQKRRGRPPKKSTKLSAFGKTVQAADEQFAQSEQNAVSRLIQSNDDLYHDLIVVKDVYVASLEENAQKEVAAFLKKRKVKKARKGTNPAYPFAQAFFHESVRESLREKISQYGKAAWVLSKAASQDPAVLIEHLRKKKGDKVKAKSGLKWLLEVYSEFQEGKDWTEIEVAANETAAQNQRLEYHANIADAFDNRHLKHYATFGKNAQRKERAGQVLLLAGYVKENGELELNELSVKEDRKLKLIFDKMVRKDQSDAST